jgi:anti-anti-sigma factor
MITFENKPPDHQLICRFPSRIDTVASATISEEMANQLESMKEPGETVLAASESIVFDLQDVTYISSSFIRICISTAKQTSKGNYSIIHCDPFIKKTFKIAGLDELLKVV